MPRVVNTDTYSDGITDPFGSATSDGREMAIQAFQALGTESGKDFYGVCPGWREPSRWATDMADVQQLHARWVRVDLPWAYTETSDGVFNWTDNDTIVSGAESRGIKVIPCFQTTPSWIRPAGTGDKWGPHTAAMQDQYAEYCRQAVLRYKPGGTFGSNVRHFEIWNEPNLSTFWQQTGGLSITNTNYTNYTNLIQKAYAQIKSADPNAVVISGGLSPHGEYGQGNGGINPVSFVEGCYAAGWGGDWDVLGHHPYDFPFAPGTNTANWSAWKQMQDTSPSLRSLMIANGDSGKKIWGTEYGYPVVPHPDSRAIDEPTQALRVTQSYDLWKTFPWAGPLCWFQNRDGVGFFYGLAGNDYRHKPAWTAYRNSVDATP